MNDVFKTPKFRIALQATILFLIAIGCMFAWCALIDIHNWHDIALVLLAGISGITGTLSFMICVDAQRSNEKGDDHEHTTG